LTGAAADAAPVVEPLQSLDILADNNVNIFDYTFFDDVSEGKLIIYDLKNIWGGGACLRIDINTDSGADQLLIEIGGAYNGDKKNSHLLTVSLKNKKAALLTANVTRQTPLIINICNGKMTVAAAGIKRTVQNIDSFAGTLSTQSITGKLDVNTPDDSIGTEKLLK
jgi:hypothetical protein